MVLMFLQFWMWYVKIGFEYTNIPCPAVFPSHSPLPSTPSSQDCVGMMLTCRWWYGWDIIAGNCTLRSPNSGVKLPLLVPYFLWKQRLPQPPAPAVLTVKLHQDLRHCGVLCTLVNFANVTTAPSIMCTFPVTTWFPAIALYKPAGDFLI